MPLSRWANGLGETRELYVERDATGQPRWRLSMAVCTGDGEFSHLPGVQRSLALVTGDLRIRFGAESWRRWEPFEPVEFPGDIPVAYAASRAVEDLGVMVWDGPAAPLEFRALAAPLVLDPARWRAAVVIAGTVRVDADAAPLGFRDTVVCESGAASVLTPDPTASVAVVGR